MMLVLFVEAPLLMRILTITYFQALNKTSLIESHRGILRVILETQTRSSTSAGLIVGTSEGARFNTFKASHRFCLESSVASPDSRHLF